MLFPLFFTVFCASATLLDVIQTVVQKMNILSVSEETM